MRLRTAVSKAATAPAFGPISSGHRFRHASRPETGCHGDHRGKPPRRYGLAFERCRRWRIKTPCCGCDPVADWRDAFHLNCPAGAGPCEPARVGMASPGSRAISSWDHRRPQPASETSRSHRTFSGSSRITSPVTPGRAPTLSSSRPPRAARCGLRRSTSRTERPGRPRIGRPALP